MASAASARSRARAKGYYDKTRREVSDEILVGSRVKLRAHYQSSAAKGFSSKLAHKWTGPFVVEEVCGPVNIRLTDGMHSRVVHVSQVEPWYEDTRC